MPATVFAEEPPGRFVWSFRPDCMAEDCAASINDIEALALPSVASSASLTSANRSTRAAPIPVIRLEDDMVTPWVWLSGQAVVLAR